MKHRAAVIVCAIDLAIWMVITIVLVTSGSDPATGGLDTAAVVAVTALLAVTTLPAFILARSGRYPGAALSLALAFPAAFVVLLVLVAVSLP